MVWIQTASRMQAESCTGPGTTFSGMEIPPDRVVKGWIPLTPYYGQRGGLVQERIAIPGSGAYHGVHEKGQERRKRLEAGPETCKRGRRPAKEKTERPILRGAPRLYGEDGAREVSPPACPAP